MTEPRETDPKANEPLEELTEEQAEKVSGGIIGDCGIEVLKRTTPALRTGLSQFSPGDGPEPPTNPTGPK